MANELGADCRAGDPTGVLMRSEKGSGRMSVVTTDVYNLGAEVWVGRPTSARAAAPSTTARRSHLAAKRAFDLVAALALLLLALPIMVITSAALRVLSGPDVLYRQTRIGHGGRPFRMHKFRTMVPGADQMIIDLRDQNEADGPLFKLRNDPRVTPLGRHLRTWAVDELPQLWNVVRGEMSLVGPRPGLPEEVAQYDHLAARRLDVKPGLTGLWQVHGRHELSFDDYVRYDLHYVEHHTFALDLTILLRTIPALVSRRGAH